VNKDEYCKSISYIKVLNNPKFKYDENVIKNSKRLNIEKTNKDRPGTVMSNTDNIKSRLMSSRTPVSNPELTKNPMTKDSNELSFFKL